jgi:pyruvate/2-oxoglutarate dehydrogenase complex dihydrolipoamide acyltransferase (E2) component
MVITMPQLGETVTEGTIVRWLKAVGDEVVEDDILFEVSTDKVDSDVPSPAAGILLEILVEEGETVAVGTALAVVASSDAPRDEIPPAPAPRSEPEPPPAPSSAPIHASTRSGPGPGAHVTRDDVARRLAARSRPLPRAEPVEAPADARGGGTVVAGADDDVEPFTAIRRRTAEHMVRSLGTAAHTLVVMEVDYSGVERTRLAARDAFRSEAGFGARRTPWRPSRNRGGSGVRGARGAGDPRCRSVAARSAGARDPRARDRGARSNAPAG